MWDQDALLQTRQHLQIEVEDIATRPHGVGRVYKKKVAGVQPEKKSGINTLYGRFDQRYAPIVHRPQKRSRIWFNTSYLGGGSVLCIEGTGLHRTVG